MVEANAAVSDCPPCRLKAEPSHSNLYWTRLPGGAVTVTDPAVATATLGAGSLDDLPLFHSLDDEHNLFLSADQTWKKVYGFCVLL